MPDELQILWLSGTAHRNCRSLFPVSRSYPFETRGGVLERYSDVLTSKALGVIADLVELDRERKEVMQARLDRRQKRAESAERIQFLDPGSTIPRTTIKVADARAGRFTGSAIPDDLQCQWIQGTGPGAKPRAPIERSIRNVAYALLSGADGWMFDGEDALGQVETMSLANQRNLRLAFARDPVFTKAAETVAGEMNQWGEDFFGHKIIEDWQNQLAFTTKIFRARGLHLDDRHIRNADGSGFSASIVDAALYVVANRQTLANEGSSLVLYLPKIQTAEEAALWHEVLGGIESSLGLESGAIKTYVLVEQIEASFQLMEIRAALGNRFVGFNTGRWDYINSVSDAMAWDSGFIHPNIDAVEMTYGYMRNYEDRVRRATNTPDEKGQFALWQGGMEPNIPVGSPEGVSASMKKATLGAEREQREGASGKWVAHWKMVQIIRPVWERVGQANQAGRSFPPLTYTEADADGLVLLESAPRTIRGARDLISVAVQYGNAFEQGFQAAALKPADFFGNEDVLYLMEDMATGEIRLSILWEWLHKQATLTAPDEETGAKEGDEFTEEMFSRLLGEEFRKLRQASNVDVHDDSKITTLPVSRTVVEAYVRCSRKAPWMVDLLNVNLSVQQEGTARQRTHDFLELFAKQGIRTTKNLDFESA